jgi:alpha-1,6-mannosyltransferase
MQHRPFQFSRLSALLLLPLAGVMAAIFRASAQGAANSHITEFIGFFLLMGVLYIGAVYLVDRFRPGALALTIIIGGGIAFRLILLPAAPALSGDVYRYQWEGRVQRRGLNPYTVFPAAPGVEGLEDPRHPLDTGRTTSTLYPPLSEWSFAWVKSIPAYKLLYTACDLASLAVLLLLLYLLKQPLAYAVVYAWNPTVIVSFALSGHHDSLAILMLLLAYAFLFLRRPALSVVSLTLAFLSKFFALVLLPVFLRRTRAAYAAVFAVVVAVAYLPYLGAGRRLFNGLGDYARGWEGNDSLFRLIRWAGNSKPQAYLVAGMLVLGLMLYALRRRMEPIPAGLFLVTGVLLLSSNAFPWYFTWIVPFLCFYRSVPLLLMSVTCVLGYAPVIAYAAGQPYRDSPLTLALEYVPVLFWLAAEAICLGLNVRRPPTWRNLAG